jgi:hypothetical protein
MTLPLRSPFGRGHHQLSAPFLWAPVASASSSISLPRPSPWRPDLHPTRLLTACSHCGDFHTLTPRKDDGQDSARNSSQPMEEVTGSDIEMRSVDPDPAGVRATLHPRIYKRRMTKSAPSRVRLLALLSPSPSESEPPERRRYGDADPLDVISVTSSNSPPQHTTRKPMRCTSSYHRASPSQIT